MTLKNTALELHMDVEIGEQAPPMNPLQVTGLNGKLTAVHLKPGETLSEAFLRIRRACQDLGRPYLISAE